jgi:benzylsuccinate CoA-transferase BbsF subunit
MSDETAPWLPLRGVRVLDFTWMIAGPLGTRLLADFGADVIKVESYNRVDRIRETGPHPDGPWSFNEDGSFNDVNLSKRSLLLNLNCPEGVDLAKRLVAVCDMVAANFTGNRLDRWGLGFDALAAVNPRLIYLNMPVFESAGPRARWTGIGTHLNAMSGINGLSGFPDDPPFGLGPLYPDFSGNPNHAMAAVLAALLARDRGAGAQFIELSQYESTASLLGPALVEYSVTGANPPRLGNRSRRAWPHNVYRCRDADTDGDPALPTDRWCAIAVETDGQWTALCDVLGRTVWAADARFATADGRRQHEDALDALIAETARGWDAEALADALQARGVQAAPVLHLADVLADPWYRAEYFSEIAGPEGCVFTTHGEPIRPRRAKHELHRAPLLGEHTDDVLRSLLGLAAEEVDRLYAAGVLN